MFTDKNNFQDKGKDSHSNEISLDFRLSLLNGKGRLFGGITYEHSDASETKESYELARAKLGISAPLPMNFKITLTGEYYDKKYDIQRSR